MRRGGHLLIKRLNNLATYRAESLEKLHISVYIGRRGKGKITLPTNGQRA